MCLKFPLEGAQSLSPQSDCDGKGAGRGCGHILTQLRHGAPQPALQGKGTRPLVRNLDPQVVVLRPADPPRTQHLARIWMVAAVPDGEAWP